MGVADSKAFCWEEEVVDQKLREVNYMREYACVDRRDRRGNAGGTNGVALEDTKRVQEKRRLGGAGDAARQEKDEEKWIQLVERENQARPEPKKGERRKTKK